MAKLRQSFNNDAGWHSMQPAQVLILLLFGGLMGLVGNAKRK